MNDEIVQRLLANRRKMAELREAIERDEDLLNLDNDDSYAWAPYAAVAIVIILAAWAGGIF